MSRKATLSLLAAIPALPAWGVPYWEVPAVMADARASFTRLTRSNSSVQSTSAISRMLVMMLRTVTLLAPWR